DLQQQNSLSEHKSAPVGIGYSNKSNICQFKASSFERSKLKSVSDLIIKPSKTKSIHQQNHHQKQRNSPSPKISAPNKISPSDTEKSKLQNSYFLTNLPPKSLLEKTINISTSTGSISPSGIPMPRQLNLNQHSNTNLHNISSSSSSRTKESPTKIDRMPYLNFPPQSQPTVDNHVIVNHPVNNITCSNSNNMNNNENIYNTNVHSRALSQYQNLQKHYVNSTNYEQAATTGKLHSNVHSSVMHNTGNTNHTPIITVHPQANQYFKQLTTPQEISSHINYPPVPPPHRHHYQHHHRDHSDNQTNSLKPGTNVFQCPAVTSDRSHSINPLSPSTIQSSVSNYLHDTRRYMKGNSLSEQKNNHCQLFQPLQQQPQHQTMPPQLNSHIIKTGIPYSPNDVNIPCSTADPPQPPGPPQPIYPYAQIHSNPSNVNMQHTYSPFIQPFVPPISYQQSKHQAATTGSMVTKTRPEMNVAIVTTTATAVSTTNNLEHRYPPYISSQTQNVNEIIHPSSDIHPNHLSSHSCISNSIQSTVTTTTTSVGAGIAITVPALSSPSNTITLAATNAVNSSVSTNCNQFIPSYHSNRTSRKSLVANTEQRRKARELYVALKQRYPSNSQSNTNNVISHQQHSNDDTSQTLELNTTLKSRNENQHEPINVLQQQYVKVGLIKQDGQLDNDEQTDKTISKQSLQQHFQSSISQKNELIPCTEGTKLRIGPSKLDEINQVKDNPAVSKTLNTSNNDTLKQYQMIGNIRRLNDDADVKASSLNDSNSTIQTCGYQSDGGLEFANYFKTNNNNSSLDYSMKQSHLTLPFQTKQQSDMQYQLRNSNIIGSLPRNLHSPYFNNQSQMINLNSIKLSNYQISDNEQRQHQLQLQQPEENLGNYARRMHERLQEGMRAAQESLWMPDLPELNMMNRLSNSSVMNSYSSGTQLSDGTVNSSSTINTNQHTTVSKTNSGQETQLKQNELKDKTENLNKDENLNIGMCSPPQPLPLIHSTNNNNPTRLNTQTNSYSSLNSGFYNWSSSKSHDNQPILRGSNSQLIGINNKMINADGLINEYSSWDLKNGGVCSDVEDLLNQHERRLMSLSGTDGGKIGNDFGKINSASDTEEFLSSDYRIQTSMRSMNYGLSGCDLIQPSSSYNNWLRKVNNENAGDGLHNRFFIPPRLSNFDTSTPQPGRFISAAPTIPQSLLARIRRRQMDGRSSSVTNSNNNDDAERIYGIVPLSPSYLYQQLMPSTGMMMSSNSSSIRTNHDNNPNLPGTISAPPGTPIKLPYAAPASLIGTNSGFSCPDSETQLNTGVGGGGRGKTSREIQILRRKLEQAEKKVNELTTQLTTNAHVVSAFEQSLTDMSQRLQNLSNTTTKKDSELHELKATIDALRNQTEIGLLKKPPINQPCELNRSSTKDTLKQENTLTNTTNTHNSNTTGNGQASLTNSSLTTSHSSLTDVESQQSHIDKVPTNASVKSSGSNVKRNGWLRNSLGKAFRKKTSSSMNSQNDLDCSTSLQHHSAYSFNSSPQHHHSYLPPCHPSNLPQSPTMDHKGLHVTTNVCQSNSSQSFGHNNSNALSVTSNAHLN
ncbi:Neuron navigator 2, partial [Schistosoma japonicum]